MPDLTVTDAAAQLTFAVHELLTRAAAEHALSVTQLRVLGILRDRTPTMADLADRLGLDRSSVSGLIDRAEKRGLVTRITGEGDGRVVLVGITPEGRAIGAELESAVESGVAALFADIEAADRAALIRVTGALRQTRP